MNNIIKKYLFNNTVKRLAIIVLMGMVFTFTPLLSDLTENVRVYAAQTVDDYKSKALKNLEKVYKYYSKSYYSTKEYSKLTKYYNKGVKAINACKDKTSINDIYNEYKELLNSVKPSILVKYQKKMEKSLLKSYKSLVTKNEYSDYNLSKLENIKDEGIEKIYGAKNKSKSKKAKTSYVKQLKNVTTLLDQTRSYVVNYINSNSNLSNNEKQAIIEEINNTSNVDAIVAIGEEYGYEEVVDETITVEQINAKIKELCKKYPKYTEDEIRVLVASANMDFVKDEDIFTIFNVSSKDELSKKGDKLDQLMIEISDLMGDKHCTNQNPLITFEPDDYGREYEDIVKFDELFLNKKMKQNANYAYKLGKTMVDEPGKTVNFAVPEKIVAGDRAAIELLDYIFDRIETTTRNFEFMKGYATRISDLSLTNTMSGYMIKSYMIGSYTCVADYRLDSLMPQNGNSINRNSLFELFPKNLLKGYSKVKK